MEGITPPIKETGSSDQIPFMVHVIDQQKIAHNCQVEGKLHVVKILAYKCIHPHPFALYL